MPTVSITIKGKVQGVFCRATAKKIAKELSIKGWIRNTPEGNVEATVSGEEKDLNTFSDWCKQGPPESIVTHVQVEPLEEEDFQDFVIMK